MFDKSYLKELNFFKKFNELIECEKDLRVYYQVIEEDKCPYEVYAESIIELENKIQELRKELNSL